MATFAEALTNGVRNAYCNVIGNAANFWEQYTPSIGVVPNPGLGAARFASRLLCNREPPSPTGNPAPFSGGQCPGVSYIVNYTIGAVSSVTGDYYLGFPSTNSTTPVQGPIGGLFTESNGNQGVRWRLVTGGGDVVFGSAGGPGNTPSSSWGVINSVTRVDGQPDDCGDPDSPTGPPSNGYNVTNVNVTYEDVNNVSITIPVGIIFAPVAIGNNNRIQIPFTVNLPIDFGVDINGTLDLPDGDINFDFGGGDGVPNSDPCRPPSSDLPDDLPDVPDDVPDPVPPLDPGEIPQVIRGAIVTTSLIGENTSVYFQDDIPDLYLPRLGNVQFLVEIDGAIAWTDTIEVRNRRQLVLCPWEGGAIRVEGFPRPGVEWDISPVFDLSSLPVTIAPYQQP